MAFTLITQGSFLSAGAAVNIDLPSSADYFKAINMTQLATTQATGRGVMFEWFGNPSFAQNSAIRWSKTNSADALNMSLVTSGGFNYLTSFPQPEGAVVGTAITAASPAVVSMTNTYSAGDKVVLYNTVGMAQIGGMAFTISSVTGSAFSLIGLPAAGFAAAATAVTARRVSSVTSVEPEFLYVTAISRAAQAVVTCSQLPVNVFVGQKLVFQVPQSFGMTEINSTNLNGIPVVVTSIANAASAYQFTISLNTTGFTTFAFPASTASPTAPLFATVASAGAQTSYDPVLQTYTGYNVSVDSFRSGMMLPAMNLQAGAQSPAGSSGDTIAWQAFKCESTFYGSV